MPSILRAFVRGGGGGEEGEGLLIHPWRAWRVDYILSCILETFLRRGGGGGPLDVPLGS